MTFCREYKVFSLTIPCVFKIEIHADTTPRAFKIDMERYHADLRAFLIEPWEFAFEALHAFMIEAHCTQLCQVFFIQALCTKKSPLMIPVYSC